MSDKKRAIPKAVDQMAPPSEQAQSVRLDNLLKEGWLSEQPEDFQQRMASLGRWVSVPEGKQLYSAGDKPDALYGIDAGLLDLAIPIIDDELCVIHRARTGFWIGDGALSPMAQRTLTVEAAANCRLFRVPFTQLRRHLAENPADWEYMHRLSTRNATLAIRILSEVLSLPPGVRVARLLLRLMSRDGTVVSTHEELGRLAGMSRATFGRTLSRLIASGAIETRYNKIIIIDLDVIEAEAKLDNA